MAHAVEVLAGGNATMFSSFLLPAGVFLGIHSSLVAALLAFP